METAVKSWLLANVVVAPNKLNFEGEGDSEMKNTRCLETPIQGLIRTIVMQAMPLLSSLIFVLFSLDALPNCTQLRFTNHQPAHEAPLDERLERFEGESEATVVKLTATGLKMRPPSINAP